MVMQHKQLCFVTLLFLFALVASQGVYQLGNYDYQLYLSSTSWGSADSSCQSNFGGRIACPNSNSDYNSVVSYVRGYTSSSFWLGGTDAGTEGSWRWADSTSWSYTVWNGGEPNNSGGNEHCLQVSTNNFWNDNNCGQGFFYVCKRTPCFGIGSLSGSVCSGHGSCVARDTCSCSGSYSGASCSAPPCFGVAANSGSVCSGHGTCTGLDSCSCSGGYTGANCATPPCFGVAANSGSVCSGHGTCTGLDTCVCAAGYEGSDCGCTSPLMHTASWSLNSSVSGSSTTFAALPGQAMSIAYNVNPSFNCLLVQANIYGTSKSSATCNTQYRIRVNNTVIATTNNNGDYNDVNQLSHVLFHGIATSVASGSQQIAVEYMTQCTETWNPQSFANSLSWDRQLIVEAFPCSQVYAVTQRPMSTFSSSLQSYTAIGSGLSVSATVSKANAAIRYVAEITRISHNLAGGLSFVNTELNGAETSFFGTGDAYGFGYRAVSFTGASFGVSAATHTVQSRIYPTYAGPTLVTATLNEDANGIDERRLAAIVYPCASNILYSSSGPGTYTVTSTSWADLPTAWSASVTTTSVGSDVYLSFETLRAQASSNTVGLRVRLLFNSNVVAAVSFNPGSFTGMRYKQVILRGVATNVAAASNTVKVQAMVFGTGSVSFDTNYNVRRNMAVIYQNKQCFGIYPTDPAVCSGHGTCTARDTCSCTGPYTGSNCQLFTCFGIAQNSGSVCSGHGTCTGVDTCACQDGYEGSDCSCVSPLLHAVQWTLNATVSGSSASFTSLPAQPMSTTYNVNPNFNCLLIQAHIYGTRKSSSNCATIYRIMVNNTVIATSNNNGLSMDNTAYTFTMFHGAAINVAAGYQVISVQYQNPACTEIWDPQTSANSLPFDRQLIIEAFPCAQMYAVTQRPMSTFSTSSSSYVDIAGGIYLSPVISKANSVVRTVSEISRIQHTSSFGVSYISTQMDGTEISFSNTGDANGWRYRSATITGATAPLSVGTHTMRTQMIGSSGGVATSAFLSEDGNGVDERRMFGIVYPCASNIFFGSQPPPPDFSVTSFTWTDLPTPWSATLTTTYPSSDIVFNFESPRVQAMSTTIGIRLRLVVDNQIVSAISFHPNTFFDYDYRQAIFRGVAVDLPPGLHTIKVEAMLFGSSGSAKFMSDPNGYSVRRMMGVVYKNKRCFGINPQDINVCSGHGACVDRNTCVCSSKWNGTQCDVPYCFNTIATNSSVCSGHGSCVFADICSCTNGWSGTQCQQAACFNISAASPSTCSGHGTCIAQDTCVCQQNYVSANCSEPVCFGVNGTNSQVCSGNGACVSANTCSCNALYTNTTCNVPICNGKNASDANVCSGHGSCLSPNTCSCVANYVGFNCHIPVCYGLNATNPLVCSGNGSCVSANNCSCLTGFTAGQCVLPICFGFNQSQPQACSSHGYCNGPDTCICNQGYYSANCSLHTCFGVKYDNASVCSGRGACVAPDVCICNAGFVSNNCQHIQCNGRNTSSNAVCSGHGSCIAPETCNCVADWTSFDCQTPICFGINATNPLVCSNSNGTCISNNLCSCAAGYSGNQCEIPICYGLQANDSRVCTFNNGTCTRRDNCVCASGYSGNQCEIPICYGLQANDSRVCTFGNGTCTRRDNCVCASGYSGNQCEIPICYGLQANDSRVCTFNNGTCTRKDNCVCASGYSGNQCEIPICYGLQANDSRVCTHSNGTCIRKDTCVCANGYSGNQCEIPFCFGLQANDSRVCTFGNGTCDRHNHCACNAGYSGNQCEIPICYGLQANDSRVCTFNNGTCTRRDNCVCASGYSGNQCEIPICYGLQANDSRVCTFNNGTCTRKDNCVCASGYSGNQCEIPICFGLQANHSRVCTFKNGTCDRKDHCACFDGYSGNECEIPICFGLQANHTNVCTFRNGTCVRKDHCSCYDFYSGNQCEIPICFGLQANDSRVCTFRNGTCDRANHCACNTGYSGNQCEIPICYGLQANDSRVCTFNNGTCTRRDNCVCASGYNGNQCEIPICFGLQANHSRVCTFKNGTCDRKDHCACYDGYSGNECEIPICYGLQANDSRVCTFNNGTCVSKNNCICNKNYIGNACEVPVCYGVPANQTNTCNTHGPCIKEDTCVCDFGWKGANCSIMHCDDRNLCTSPANGLCTGPNNCTCNWNDFMGINCSIPMCFGFSANDSRVCSGHGTCINKHTCSCQTNFVGNNCQYPVCFGIDSTQSRVCAGHGTCVAPNTCNCNSGYSSNDCSSTSCNGLLSTDFRVCNQQGTCIAPDTCNCNDNFGGVNCQLPKCNGLTSTSSQVCNARGNCTAVNTCNCNKGYSGQFCTVLDDTQLSCYGRIASDTLVCSGHGTCSSQNNCTCQNGYSGSQCSDTLCFGKTSNAFDVCSGAGTCVAPDTCRCNQGYQGTTCQIISCYAILSNNSQVCSGRGQCVLPDTCLCQSGYVGNCAAAICFGINSTSPNVCSGHGTCSTPNQCTCQTGYVGSTCATRMCFGQPHTFAGTCSGHGTCNIPNVCTCQNGFAGQQCETPVCFGIPATNTSAVCSGKGTCVGNNTCLCSVQWRGNAQCSACSPDYTGANCDTRRCDEQLTCNGRGTCAADFTCQCNKDAVNGYWNGTFCDACLNNYYGPSCKVNCDPLVTCNAHGSCTNDGTCSCYDDDVLGHYTGTSCDNCKPSWYGSRCNLFASSYYNISSTGDRIEGTLVMGAYLPSEIPCNILFAPESVAKFGTNPRCSWPDKPANVRSFQVVFGAAPTLVPNEIIYMNINFYENKTSYVAITINAPTNPVRPFAQVTGPTRISVCDGVTLDGSSSTSLDRRALRYTWSILSGFKLAVISQYLLTQNNNKMITVPSDMLDSGFTFTFGLVVTNYLGGSSTVATWNVTKTSDSLALVTVQGQSTQFTSTSAFFSLTALVTFPTCFYSNREITYSWKQLRGPLVTPTSGTQNRTLVFLPFTFPKFAEPQQYTFEVTVRPVANPDAFSTAQVAVVTQPLDIVAIIRGGGNRTESRSDVITLDASLSYDPEYVKNVPESFTWTCYTPNGAFCTFNNFALPNNASIVNIPELTLAAGIYNFTVEYTKGSRAASAFVIISVSAARLPKVTITTILPPSINRNEIVKVQGIASIFGGSVADLTFLWNIRSSTGPVTLQPSDLLTSLTDPNLVIKPNVLIIGEQYTFVLIVSYTANSKRQTVVSTVSGFAATQFTSVNVPPLPGSLQVTPPVGVAAQTDFTISASQWIDEDLPLSYSFGYYQGNQFITLASASSANTVTMKLPAGSASSNYSYIISVRVADSLGAVTELNSTVKVTVPVSSNSSALVAQLANQASSSLASALSNNDPNAVSQVVTSIVQLINIPTPAVVDPTLPKNNCPNSCSGHGSCVRDVTCVCDVGYSTSDCSLTDEELKKRQALRAQLLTSMVSTAFTPGEPVTSEKVEQQAGILSQLTANPEELSPASAKLAVSFAASIISAATLPADPSKGQAAIVISDDTADSIAGVLSNLAGSAFSTTSASQPDKDVASSVASIVTQLGGAVLNAKVPGEATVQLTQPALSMALKKEFANKINNLNMQVVQSDPTKPAANVVLPSGILSKRQAATGAINVQAISFTGNPYAYSNASRNISSSVLSFALKTESNTEITIKNLAQPIYLTVPGKFNPSDFPVGCVLTISAIPECRYWDTTRETWSTDGCKVANVTSTYIICACNHLTDFGGFVGQVIPDMNLLSVQDLTAHLNPENMLTFGIVVGLAGFYIIMMVVCYVLDVLYQPKNEAARKAEIELANMGKLRMVIEALKRDHLWFSFIFRPSTVKTYTRPQRLTTLYVIICIVLVINALFFGQTQPSLIKTITASIISQFGALPVIILTINLFVKTRIAEKKKEPIKTIPTVLFDDLGAFELKELTEKNIIMSRPHQFFGVPLAHLMQRKSEIALRVPGKLLQMFVRLENGTTNASDLQQDNQDAEQKRHIRYLLNNEPVVDLNNYETKLIASCIVQFFAELPEPMFTREQVELCKQKEQVKTYIESLQVDKYETLKRTIQLLRHLHVQQSIQLEQVCAWLAPSFAQAMSGENTMASAQDSVAMSDTLQYMLQNADSLFVARQEENERDIDATNVLLAVDETEQRIAPVVAEKPLQQKGSLNKSTSASKSSDVIEVETRMEDRKDRRKSLKLTVKASSNPLTKLQYQMGKALDFGDNILDKAELKIRQTSKTVAANPFSPKVFIAFFICALVYYGMIASICVIMELVFTKLWLRFLTTLVICVGIILPVVGFQFFYFSQKREKFRLEQVWYIPKRLLIGVAIFAVICLIIAIIAMSVACGLQFWTWTYGIEHTAIVFVTMIGLAVNAIVFIVLNLKKPELIVQEIKTEPEEPFPVYALFLIYPFIWAGIGVMSWVLVQYGTKFGPKKANAWLAAVALGMGQNVLIVEPLKIVLMVVVVNWFINALNAAFFNWNVTATTALQEDVTNMK